MTELTAQDGHRMRVRDSGLLSSSRRFTLYCECGYKSNSAKNIKQAVIFGKKHLAFVIHRPEEARAASARYAMYRETRR